MKIFDSHAHLGHDVVFDETITEQTLDSIFSEFSIDGALIQPFITRPYINEAKDIHDRIYRYIQQKGENFYGMISICPHLYPDELEKECARCVNELGFKGIKIATTAHGVNPSSENGLHIFEIANSLDIAVMIHTGGGTFGEPHLLEKPAKSFPHVPIVIAHGGGESRVDESIRLAKTYDNVFVEPSWINLLSMEKFARTIGAGKLMYSSDMPQNTPAELAIFNSVFTSREDREKVFWKTAHDVFSI